MRRHHKRRRNSHVREQRREGIPAYVRACKSVRARSGSWRTCPGSWCVAHLQGREPGKPKEGRTLQPSGCEHVAFETCTHAAPNGAV